MKKEYDWNLTDLKRVKKNNLKVFSCFSCGGGSTMGYKLAGYTMLGNCEIDAQMMKIYRHNHKPLYPFLMDIREFKNIPLDQLPKELLELDILDGSPPCSAFSMSGVREDAWGKKKAFREGQAVQVLDELFFDFIDVVERLKPKVVIAENVVGMVGGNAKWYVKEVIKGFQRVGYDVQLFKLNSATMGVPQRRERIFFIARRKSLNWNNLKLDFNEQPITYGEIRSGRGKRMTPTTTTYKRWLKRKPSDRKIADITKRTEGKQVSFNTAILHNNLVPPTLVSNGIYVRYDEPYHISTQDIINIQSFPKDYEFLGLSPMYVCGMSVPPVMMKKISEQVYKQWFKKE